jgi:cytochrome oxidase Cu insertion factor (SCO1/SenC/PrrC family)
VPRLDDTRARRLVWIALAATLVIVVAVALWKLRFGPGSAAGLPVYGDVPPFALVERDGRAVTSASLTGQVWIADFIFTRCGGMCPGLTTTMAALMRRLARDGGGDVRAVTITVDPAHDDPAALSRYAERYGADPARWLFLTGEHDAIERLVRRRANVRAHPSPLPTATASSWSIGISGSAATTTGPIPRASPSSRPTSHDSRRPAERAAPPGCAFQRTSNSTACLSSGVRKKIALLFPFGQPPLGSWWNAKLVDSVGWIGSVSVAKSLVFAYHCTVNVPGVAPSVAIET